MRTFTQKLAFLLVALLCYIGVQAQETITLTGNISQDLTPGQSYLFYDSGGPTGSYGSSQNYTAVLTNVGGSITINFSSLVTESSSSCYDWDYMLIYDDETLIGRAQTGCATATITTNQDYVAESGTLKIEWHSDGSGAYAGWEATITAAGGGEVTCNMVETVEVTDVDASQATINWTGGDGSYSIEYKAASADKWTSVEDISATSYVLTGLTPNTTYSVKVYNVCGVGSVSYAKTASFTTAIGLPYSEPFSASSIPSGWSKQTGVLNDDGSAALSPASGSYHWSFGNSSGVFDSHAYIEVYSSQNQWLVSPVIPMEDGYQLSFKLALTYWNGDNVPCSSRASQPDARFVVLCSNDGGSNWTVLREWNNTGSEYVFDDIVCSAEGQEEEIDLSNYANQNIQIGFYIYHSTGGDNKLHIDNVNIAPLPTCLKPTELHEIDGRATKSSVQLDWTANTGETAWKLQYKKVSDAEWNTVDVTSKPYTLSGLETFTEYNVQVAANCGGGDISDYGKAITVKTAAGVPFAQGFSSPSLPSEWKRFAGSFEGLQNGGEELEAVDAGWKIAGTSALKNGVFPDSASHLILNIAGTDTKHWIVSPIIEMEAGYQLSFDLALTASDGTSPAAVTPGQQQDDKFIVAINAGEGWTDLCKWLNEGDGLPYDEINATANGQVIKIDLSDYADKAIQIAFYGESTAAGGDNNLHISNLKIAEIPACEPATQLNITGIGGTFATAVWDNIEGAVWQYSLVANPAADFVPTDFVTLDAGVYTLTLSDLSENTNYGFFLRRKCGEADFSDIISRSFKTIQTPVVLDSEHPFSDNFESGNKWVLINGDQTNQWAYGTAVSNGGSHALYISKDAGVSNEMTYETSANTSYVYASKTFTFAETGVYTFSYDWKNNGGSSYYLRAYLAPLSAEPNAGSSAPYSGWTKLHSESELYGQSDWQHESFEYRIEEAGTYKVILYWYNYYGSSNYNPPAAVDNFAISRLSCPKPEGLALAELGAETAKFEWESASDGSFEYAYALLADDMPEEFTPVDENSVVLSGLTSLTAYKFYLRKSCGETDKSDVLSLNFTTAQLPLEVGNAFSDDFESGNNWLFVNGTLTNQWVLGEAAHNGEGSHALYISKDNGASHSYNVSSSTVVFATKTFNFEDGNYIFKYDWISNGEYYSGAPCDYMRVVLVPGAADLIAGTTPVGFGPSALPAGWVAIDGGAHQGINSWQSLVSDEIAIAEGLYTVVLVWRNDGSSGSDAPAAFDNFSISKVVCQTPIGLQVVADSTTTSSVVLTWTPKGAEENWLVRYRKVGAEAWNTPIAVAHVDGNAADSLKIEGLDASSAYEAQVASLCDPSDPESASEYSASITFASGCDAISSLSENFDGITEIPSNANKLPVCWSFINTNTSSSHNYYPTILESATLAHSGSNSLYFHSSAYASSNGPENQYAVLPEMTSVSDKRIKFYARPFSSGSNDPCFAVGVMTDPADTSTFVPVYTRCGYLAEYAPFVIPLDSYTGNGKFIAIKLDVAAQGGDYTHGLYIDDVVVEDIPSCLEPSGLAAALTQGDGSVATLSWNAGADETAWVVEYSLNADFSDALLLNINETPVANLVDLTPESVYYARVKAVCGEGNESPWTNAISFKPTNIFSLLINNGMTTNAYVPITTSYMDEGAASQFIIPAADLASIQWATINELTFYNSLSSIDFGTAKYDVYMASVDNDAFSSSSYVAWASLTKVKNAATVTVSGNQMVITLDNPYLYEGGNLLIGFDQTLTNSSYISSSWQGVTASSAAIYDYGSYGPYSGNFRPKMLISYTPGEAPSCIKPTALAVALTEGDGSVASLSWTAGGDETAWVVEYSRNEDFSDALTLNVSETAASLTGLTAEVTYYARVKAVCGEGIESEYSNAISFKPTNAMALTINRGAVQAEKVPFDGYNADYYNTVSQFIIPADSLAGLQWATFNKLTFFESGTDAKTLPSDKFEVYMAEVSDATISALADWSSLSKVMNEATLSLNGGQMEVTLSDPYLYRGGNLLIGFKQTAIGSYKRIYWLGVTAQGASFGGTSESSASQQNFLPKMKIDYVPGEEPSCYVPTGLALSNVTAEGVSAAWDNEEGVAWQYAVVLASAGVPADGDYIDIAANSVVIESGLNDNADYIFYLRKNCGETDGVSQAVSASFHTPQLPASVPFADNFEEGNNWLFVNGANGWIIGTDAHNGEGSTQAMYISSNGSTNTYNVSSASVSYATKRFSIPMGSYIFSYDWKANGESTYDYLRVALVPDSIELPASFSYTTNLPTGWIAMDGGAKLNQSTAWATYTSAETSVAEGDYKMVFVWRNDGMYGDQAPAAIDNFSIQKVLCSQPTAVTISDLTATSAAIGWTAPAEQSAWQIVCSTDADVVPAEATPIDVNANPYIISELTPETNYYVYVRANCDDDQFSNWSARGSFRTASTCQTPNGLKLDEVSVSAATISWNTFGQSEFNLRYKAAADADWTILNDAASPKLIESLAANTSYSVQVQAACEDADSWSTTFTFKTPCNAWSIVEDGNYVEDFEAYAGSAYNVNSAAPDCWAVAADQSVKPHVIGSGNYKYVHSGSKALTFYGSGNCYAALPQFVEALSGLQISFWMQTESAANGNLILGYITAADQGDFATFQPIDSLDRSYNVMTNHEISLENVPAEAARLAFCWNYSGQWSCCIDDIEVSLIPTCLKPTGLAISEVAARSAKAEWTAGAEEQSAWQIALDTIAGFNPDTLSNLIDVNENPYVLADLLPEHTYYMYVRANCAEDDKSKWSNLASFTTTVACPAPTALAAILTPGNGSIATLSWNAGAEENAWVVEYSLNADFSDAEVVSATDTFVNLSGLTAEATYYARVKADCGELDGESLYSATISFKPTDAYELLINDGAATNGYVPVYGNYVDHFSQGQFIVPAEQLEELVWDSIKSLTFFAAIDSHDFGAAQFKAYVAELEESSFGYAALYDWSDLHQVMAAASLSVADGKMVVTFDEAYQYEGGNLLIGIEQTVPGTYKDFFWYGVSADYASVGGYKNKTSLQLTIAWRNFLPKMLIDYAPGVEPACKKPTGLAVSDITASGAIVAWDEVEGANWEYAVLPASEPAPASFALSTSAHSVALDQLSENTQYVFYLRRACGEDGNSAVISIDFTTDILKAAIPFYENFEAASSGWKLVNGDQPNAWMIGGGAASTGDKALYISSNGSENTYDKDVQSSTFAYILLDFDKTGSYHISYEWKANGDYDPEAGEIYDYLRVALVPAAVSFEAGDADLPTGAIALDGGQELYGAEGWHDFAVDLENISAGLYKLVFAWFNDEQEGYDTPAAIDNIAVVYTSYPTGISNGAGIENQAIKFIRDEKVFILVNGIIYDATGRKVEVVK